MNIVNLEAYAMSQGITKSYQSMSLAEQQLLRYNYIMAVTTKQQGDFANTSSTYANQIRLLTLNFRSLSAVIGQGLIAAILPGIQALNALLAKLMQVAEAFRNFMYTLMGKKAEGSTGGIVDEYAGLGDAVTDMEDMGDAESDAADAAKNLKKALSVLPFDELNQLASAATDTGDGLSNAGTGTTGALDSIGFDGLADAIHDLGETDTTGPINEWAKRIREAFLAHDWEGLGKEIADGLNRGLQFVYDAINWDKVGPKITAFTDAFTRTFNSLVDNFDWNLLGRTIGAGINTIVNSLNQLIEGIDFKNLGTKLSVGFRGMVDEIDWRNLGNLLGNKFMIAWDILNGFVTDMSRKSDAGLTGWAELGIALGNAVNGIFEKINFEEIAYTLTTGINGAFETLKNFTETVEWGDIAQNVSNGLNMAFTNLRWEDAGKSLEAFLDDLDGFMLDVARDTDWEAFGRGIGEFLSQINWEEHFMNLLSVLKEVLGGIWEGLGDTSAGKFVQGILIFELGMKLMPFVNKLVNFFTGSTVTQKLSSAFQNLFSNSLPGATKALENAGKVAGTAASGGFKSLLTAIGSSGAGIGLIAVLPIATKLLAGFVEKLQGQNGKLSEMGGAINDLAGKLQNFGILSSNQVEEILKIVDTCEDAQMSSQEMADTVMQKFAEWGISTQNVNSVLQDNEYWTTKTKESVDLLSESAQQLGEGMSKTAGEIDLSSLTMKEAMGGFRDILYDLSISGSEFSGTYQGILMSMDNTLSSAGTAQEALDMLVGQFEAAGVPVDEFMKYLSEKFPEAVKEVKKSVDQNIPQAQRTISNAMGTAEQDVSNSAENIKNDTAEMAGSMDKSVADASSNIEANTETSWGNAYDSLFSSISSMDKDTKQTMKSVMTTVQSYWQSVLINTNQIWEKAAQKVSSELKNMLSSTNSSVSSMKSSFSGLERSITSSFSGIARSSSDAATNIANSFSGLGNRIANSIGDLYYIGYNAAQSLANGFRSVHIPVPDWNITGWEYHNIGNGGSMYTPIFSVNWYKTGGLFDGSSVIGVGEAGKEAVLPLENRRTMSMIADSILSNASGMEMDEQTLTNAVARGVAMAMMNNQQNPITVNCYAELKTENDEVLARAVARGQDKIDYRFNPTTQFGY